MMNLTIDIGNTLIKLAVFDGDKLIESIVKKQLTASLLNSLHQKHHIQKSIFSSVKANGSNEILLKKYNFLALNHSTPLPLLIKYKTLTTLGIDRISAVVGAKSKFQNTNLLIIDIGTCITYDFLNAKNEYLGGSISPGFQMRFKALHHFTEKLPLVKFNENGLKLIGNSTKNSIISGVYNGMKHEIDGIINTYSLQYEALKIVLTGGDRKLFDLEPKNRIFADEFLVQKGLNEILNYNEK